MFEKILVINLCSTFFMTGLIWFVQVVHYPGYLHIPRPSFQLYHRQHIQRTGLIVIPPMITELFTSMWLVWSFEQFWMLNTAGLCLLLTIWASTFFLQARYHQALQREYTKAVVLKLINANWIRSLLWSLKTILGIYILIKLI